MSYLDRSNHRLRTYMYVVTLCDAQCVSREFGYTCNPACTVKILYGFYSSLSIQKKLKPWFGRVGTGVKFNNHTPIWVFTNFELK